MRLYVYKSVVVAMMLALSCGDMFAAGAKAGMLRSNGGVSVNGAPVTPLTTVFSGDRIETSPQAVGSLTLGGNSLLMDPNSSMVFHGQDVDFYCGGGTFQTTQGMSARYGQTLVKPAQASARFEVQQSGTVVKISALQGDLNVTEGAKSFDLAAGRSMNVAYTDCTQMAANDTQDSAGSASGSGGQQSPQTPTPINSDNSNLTKALVIAPTVVATVALAGIIAVSQTPKPVSPSAP